MEFRCKLKVILAERDIRHGEFAKEIGISPAAMSAIVNTHSLPSFPITYLICEKLDLPIHAIWEKK
jgi:DNA-binding XRE family transcriptional regulator